MILNASDAKISRYLILFSPILAMTLQSFFKVEITAALAALAPDQAHNIYFLFRMALAGLFVLLLYKVSVDGSRSVPSHDAFAGERAERDPLLGLRGLACLNVFFGHWFLVVAAPSLPAHDAWGYALRATLGFSPWCGVWIFFTLSGYLIVKGFVSGRHALDNSGIQKYYRNRLLRIVPVYVAAIALTSVLKDPQALNVLDAQARTRMLEALLFDQGGSGVIGALWSVSTEFQFYLLAPLVTILLVAALRRLTNLCLFTIVQLALFAVLKLSLLTWLPQMWHAHVYFPLLSNLDCFLCGAVTAMAVEKLRAEGFYLRGGMIFGALTLVVSQGLFSFWSYPEMVSISRDTPAAARGSTFWRWRRA